MLWKTHFVGGILVGSIVAGSSAINPIFGISVAALSSLLPDIDSPHSLIGRPLLPVSFVVEKIEGHRQFFHSLLAAAVFTMVVNNMFPAYYPFALAGYLSHLLLDMLNPEGVPLFWPLNFRVSIPLVNTGSIFEGVILLIISVSAAVSVLFLNIMPAFPIVSKLVSQLL